MSARAPAVLLVGAGRMGGALLRGWLRNRSIRIVVVEPQADAALRKLCRSHRVPLFPALVHVNPQSVGTCVVALKPQVLKTEIAALAPFAQSGALMISIAAGFGIKAMAKAWGGGARIIRSMPNTPGAIGKGITALHAGARATAADRRKAQDLLAALGETVWLKREDLIDSATAVSGSGPAYVFLLAEALAAAGEAEGLPKETALRLACATISGAGALLETAARSPGELRRDVTSPGGTTEAALKILMGKGGLAPLMKRAVSAARKKARLLSS